MSRLRNLIKKYEKEIKKLEIEVKTFEGFEKKVSEHALVSMTCMVEGLKLGAKLALEDLKDC